MTEMPVAGAPTATSETAASTVGVVRATPVTEVWMATRAATSITTQITNFGPATAAFPTQATRSIFGSTLVVRTTAVDGTQAGTTLSFGSIR